MEILLADSLTWVYPDRLDAVSGSSTFVLDVPQNGVASVNVILKNIEDRGTVRFHGESLNEKINWNISLFRLHDVAVERNTGAVGFCEREDQPNQYVTRKAPFRVYDAMEPMSKAAFVAEKENMVLQIRIPVPVNCKCGTYDIVLYFNQDAATLRLQVYPVSLVPCGKDSFFYTNWYSAGNLVARHNLEKDSAAYFKILKKYAEQMYQARQNTFLIPLSTIFTYAPEKNEFILNRSKLKKIVKIFTDAGLYYIEGGHFGCRTGGWVSPFEVVMSHHGVESMEANRDIASMASQLMQEIQKNGWQDRYIQHVADEPIPQNAASFRILAGIIRKYMPGIPLIDAMSDPEIAGAVNIWCPQIQRYENHQQDFEETRQQGDSIWLYTCCFPGGQYLNRLLDGELLRPVLLGWGCAYYRIDGFLHWGFNYYKATQNPFEENCPDHGGGNHLPPGDTHIVYPGKNGPWPSVRLEAQRTGIEDLELLRILQKKNPSVADSILSTMFRKFNDYTTDLTTYRACRKRILEALTATCK